MWFDTLILQLRLHMAYRVNGILYRLRFLRLPYENSFAKTLGLVLAVLREIFGSVVCLVHHLWPFIIFCGEAGNQQKRKNN